VGGAEKGNGRPRAGLSGGDRATRNSFYTQRCAASVLAVFTVVYVIIRHYVPIRPGCLKQGFAFALGTLVRFLRLKLPKINRFTQTALDGQCRSGARSFRLFG
jgi:hypothetical protein